MFQLQAIIYENEGINLSEPAEVLGKNRPQADTLVTTLESLGLVVKERIKNVPPKVVVKLSNRGRKLLECMRESGLIEA